MVREHVAQLRPRRRAIRELNLVIQNQISCNGQIRWQLSQKKTIFTRFQTSPYLPEHQY